MVSSVNVNPTTEETEKVVVETQVVPAPIPKVNVWQVKQTGKANPLHGKATTSTTTKRNKENACFN
jgi:la-related protein 1